MTKRKFTHPKDAPEGHEWETVGGEKVRQLKYFDGTDRYSIAGVVGGKLLTWTDSGLFIKNVESNNCLVDAPKKGEVWLNIYPSGFISGWQTKKEADYSASVTASRERIARIRVPYTEGQFDE